MTEYWVAGYTLDEYYILLQSVGERYSWGIKHLYDSDYPNLTRELPNTRRLLIKLNKTIVEIEKSIYDTLKRGPK